MKLATFMMPLHPPCRNHGETLAEDREAILLADRLRATSKRTSASIRQHDIMLP